jgi:hypothetical protein
LGLFQQHHTSWDSFDVEDLTLLLPLLTDDQDENMADVQNPNRLLKSLSADTSRIKNYLAHLFNAICVVIGVIGWLILFRHYGNGAGWQPIRRLSAKGGGGVAASTAPEENDFIDKFVNTLFMLEDDSMTFGMQMVVGTLLLLFHIAFEFVKSYETGAVMPAKWVRLDEPPPDSSGSPTRISRSGKTIWIKEVWDPRKHGEPFYYKLMGMPCMWFTSHDALNDLKAFISNARKTRICAIKPQEIAFLVLSGEEGRTEVQHCFLNSKLYSGRHHSFIEDLDQIDGVKRLGIELLFFDEDLQAPGYDYCGEFSSLGQPDGENDERSVLVTSRTHEIYQSGMESHSLHSQSLTTGRDSDLATGSRSGASALYSRSDTEKSKASTAPP